MCVVVLCTSCASSKKVVYLQDVVPLKQQDIEQKYEVYIHIVSVGKWFDRQWRSAYVGILGG